ncbi:tail fiber domain-containing protein [Primorskyibacter flagellatus]|nr:tail fiber domain-containing protein [Primorskyibacter flagellatus]
MATLSTAPRFTVVTLASATAGPFDLSFRLFDADSVDVFVNSVPATNWTLSANFVDGFDDNASITFDAPLEIGDNIWIESNLNPSRASDYLDGPGLTAKLNIELARLWSATADNRRSIRNSVRFFQPLSPLKISPGKVLVGNLAGDALEFGPTVADLGAGAESAAASAAAAAVSEANAAADAASGRALLEATILAAVSAGAHIYADTTDGLASTSDGDIFMVADGLSIITYENDGGVAVEIGRTMPRRFPSLAAMVSAPGMVNGAYVSVDSGYNGEPESFLFDTGTSYTENGREVFDATGGVSGQFISTRHWFKTPLEFMMDPRVSTFFESAPTVSVSTRFRAGRFTYTMALDTATDHQWATAGGVKFYVDPETNGCRHVDALAPAKNGHLSEVIDRTDDYAKIQAIWAAGNIEFGVGHHYSTARLEYRSNQTILLPPHETGWIVFANDVTPAIRSKDGLAASRVHIENLWVTRGSSTDDRLAFNFDKTTLSTFLNCGNSNFRQGMSMNRVDASAVFFNYVHNYESRTCLIGIINENDGTSPNGNWFDKININDVGLWNLFVADRIGIKVGGYGNTWSRVRLGQSTENIGGSGFVFDVISGSNHVFGLYVEGTYEHSVENQSNNTLRKNMIIGFHLDSLYAGPIYDPYGTLSVVDADQSWWVKTDVEIGCNLRGETLTAWSEASIPAVHVRARDGVAAALFRMSTATTDIGGSRNFDIKLLGTGLTGTGFAPIAQIHMDSVHRLSIDKNGVLHPASDGGVDLGRSSHRFEDIFSQNGVSTTSDGRLKEQIEELDDVLMQVAATLKTLMKRWKWRSAVAEKGDDARWHFGWIAQEAIQVFTDAGLDWREYGVFTFDEWWEADVRTLPIYDMILEEQDDDEPDEVLVEPEVIVRMTFTTEAQALEATYDPETVQRCDRYGVRKDELLALVIAAS